MPTTALSCRPMPLISPTGALSGWWSPDHVPPNLAKEAVRYLRVTALRGAALLGRKMK